MCPKLKFFIYSILISLIERLSCEKGNERRVIVGGGEVVKNMLYQIVANKLFPYLTQATRPTGRIH